MDGTYNPKNAKTPILIKLHRLSWVIVNQTIFRYSPFFCHGWRRFLLRCYGAKIARSATVGRLARIDSPWNLTMGERSMICSNAWVSCLAPIVLGDQVLVSEYAKLLTGSHVSNSVNFKGVISSIVIKDNAWICTGAMLVSGGRRKLTIGQAAMVGAGAVVVLNVGDREIVMGNPAQCIGERRFNKE